MIALMPMADRAVLLQEIRVAMAATLRTSAACCDTCPYFTSPRVAGRRACRYSAWMRLWRWFLGMNLCRHHPWLAVPRGPAERCDAISEAVAQ